MSSSVDSAGPVDSTFETAGSSTAFMDSAGSVDELVKHWIQQGQAQKSSKWPTYAWVAEKLGGSKKNNRVKSLTWEVPCLILLELFAATSVLGFNEKAGSLTFAFGLYDFSLVSFSCSFSSAPSADRPRTW